MAVVNRHIKNYLRDYLRMKLPGFAVLLRGKWGCGKTWFIKTFIDDVSKENEYRFAYISLNGVRKLEEIDKRLFLALHPKLAGKYANLIAHLSTGILRLGQVNELIEDFKFSDFTHAVENRILVFDDVERCVVQIEETLGYINDFVEQMGLKVIIIGNEEEIEKDDGEKSRHDDEGAQIPPSKNKYLLIKEKLIGKRFQVGHDIHAVLDEFFKRIKSKEVRTFLMSHREILRSIFAESETDNLRILLQTMWDFERFYVLIDEKFRKIDELMSNLLGVFLCLSFDSNSGRISVVDLQDLEAFRVHRILVQQNPEAKPPKIAGTFKRYPSIDSYHLILSSEAWKEWFEKGSISKEKIMEGLSNSGYLKKEQPTWVSLWYWSRLEDKEFNAVYASVITECKRHKFVKLPIILHIAGVFISLSKAGLSAMTPGDVVKECRKYIDTVLQAGKLEFMSTEDFRYSRVDAWGGLGYQGSDTKEFQEIAEYMRSKLNEMEMQALKEASSAVLKVMETDTLHFRRMITINNVEQLYYDKPVFMNVRSADFFQSLLKVSNENKWYVFSALQTRYEYIHAAPALEGELTFLTELNEQIDQYVSSHPGIVSSYILDSARIKYLKSSMQFIQTFVEQKKKDEPSEK